MSGRCSSATTRDVRLFEYLFTCLFSEWKTRERETRSVGWGGGGRGGGISLHGRLFFRSKKNLQLYPAETGMAAFLCSNAANVAKVNKSLTISNAPRKSPNRTNRVS